MSKSAHVILIPVLYHASFFSDIEQKLFKEKAQFIESKKAKNITVLEEVCFRSEDWASPFKLSSSGSIFSGFNVRGKFTNLIYFSNLFSF
jgi:hypothetical protein